MTSQNDKAVKIATTTKKNVHCISESDDSEYEFK